MKTFVFNLPSLSKVTFKKTVGTDSHYELKDSPILFVDELQCGYLSSIQKLPNVVEVKVRDSMAIFGSLLWLFGPRDIRMVQVSGRSLGINKVTFDMALSGVGWWMDSP